MIFIILIAAFLFPHKAHALVLSETEIAAIEQKTLEERERDPQYITERILDVFNGSQTMVSIGLCESTLRQFDGESPLVSKTNDVGVLQINLAAHAKNALALGYDIYTLEGNLAYGKYLYDQQGTGPWYMSAHCWG